MKLNAAQIDIVEQQVSVRPIEDDSPAMPQLKEVFGDHTFYVDANGLHVLEVLPEDMDGAQPGTAAIIQIAEWTNEDKNALAPIEPRAAGSVVSITGETVNGGANDAPGADGPDGDAS